MNALNPSHAALIAEVTALRATLNDAVELCEALRSERDRLRDFALIVERSACLRQHVSGKCICFACEARDALGRAAL